VSRGSSILRGDRVSGQANPGFGAPASGPQRGGLTKRLPHVKNHWKLKAQGPRPELEVIIKTRAAVLYEMGKPAPYADSRPLVIDEIDLEGPGPGEVLVEIAAAGLCHSDLSVVNASRPRVMPMVLGHEASGIVREVGPGVTAAGPGDCVVFSYVPLCGRCLPCATGRPALCENGSAANAAGTLLSGKRRFRNAAGKELNHHLGVSAFSQYTVCAQESLIRIPADFPIEKASLFGCAVLTGVGAVVNTAKIEPGTSVAVFGVGGIGLSAVMGAKLAGAMPIVAVDVLEAKLDLARELGATHTVNSRTQNAVEAIKEITRGGAACAFEAVGSQAVLASAYAATRRGGKTVAIGLPHPKELFSTAAAGLVAEERTVMGSYMGSSIPQRDIPRFMALYQAGQLPVDRLFSKTIEIDALNTALDALDRGEVVRQILAFP
jgi:alcohol dehydrogenase